MGEPAQPTPAPTVGPMPPVSTTACPSSSAIGRTSDSDLTHAKYKETAEKDYREQCASLFEASKLCSHALYSLARFANFRHSLILKQSVALILDKGHGP